MTAGSVALGHLIYAIRPSLAEGLSLISVYSSPAFAFAGLTFPLQAMPFLGRYWAMSLPITHYLDFQVHAGQLGSTFFSQFPALAAMALLTLVFGGLGLTLTVRRGALLAQNSGPPAGRSNRESSLNFIFGLRGAFLAAGRDLMGNKAARTVMIGGVIFYSLLYPLPFHNEVPQKLPLFVVDQARSDLSRQLMRMIDSTEGVRVAAVTDSPQLALERMKGGDATAVLIIPGDFSRNIMRSGKTILPLYCGANYLAFLPRGLHRRAPRGGKSRRGRACGTLSESGDAAAFRPFPPGARAGIRLHPVQSRGQLFSEHRARRLRGHPPADHDHRLRHDVRQGMEQPDTRGARQRRVRDDRPDSAVLLPLLSARLLLFLAAAHIYDVPRPHSFGLLLLFLFPLFWAAASLAAFSDACSKRRKWSLWPFSPAPCPCSFFPEPCGRRRPCPLRRASRRSSCPPLPASSGYRLIMGRGAGFGGNHAVVASALGAGPGLLRPGDLSGAGRKSLNIRVRQSFCPADSAPSDA